MLGGGCALSVLVPKAPPPGAAWPMSLRYLVGGIWRFVLSPQVRTPQVVTSKVRIPLGKMLVCPCPIAPHVAHTSDIVVHVVARGAPLEPFEFGGSLCAWSAVIGWIG